MGIRTHVSRNPAMVLGGLKEGVTPLEMADSYLTLAHGGNRASGTLAAYDRGPVAFTKVDGGSIHDKNEVRTKRVVPQSVADQTTQILQTVVSSGTGTHAQTGDFAAGKTGTTEDYQDAWFVGYSDKLTVAVWVGYVKGGLPMETEYHGQPVAGGTFPADIWQDFMVSAKRIRDARAKKPTTDEAPPGLAPVPTSAPPANQVPDGEKRSAKGKGHGGARQPARAPAQPPTGEKPPSNQTPPPATGAPSPGSGPNGGASPGSGGAPPGTGTPPANGTAPGAGNGAPAGGPP
jgi:penicillin-binding protein 1A